jgi:hypothetical protein
MASKYAWFVGGMFVGAAIASLVASLVATIAIATWL